MRWTSASLASLQAREARRCDVCGLVPSAADDDGETQVPGAGMYLWVRQGEVRRETVPLCSRCGTAVGVTALTRWAIEEEEG